MKEVVVIRDMVGIFNIKCPLCNTEQVIDRTGKFYLKAKIFCDNCGATIVAQLSGIRQAIHVINDNNWQQNDVPLMMKKEAKVENNTIEQVSPTNKLTIEKSALYIGTVTCPFCLQNNIVRYYGIAPHSGQWCSSNNCYTELVVTIFTKQAVGGDISNWYKTN